MLTKEAFNALLKTLEEPPSNVKFFFATTEPHKVLPTIMSRCQRFNLSRIATEKIIEKLQAICGDLQIEIEPEALALIAQLADGGLRDAESLLDQIHAFHGGKITVENISTILGMVSRDCFFELDRAGKEGNLAMAFELAHQVFAQGKDLVHFVESLTEHFRNLLMVKLAGKEAPFLVLSESERAKYESAAKLYTQEQCLTLLDFLAEATQQIRFAPSGRIALEAILLKVLRSHQRLPVEFLVRRLTELEQALTGGVPPEPKKQPPPVKESGFKESGFKESSISEDPTPSARDLGKRETRAAPKPIEPKQGEARSLPPEKQRRYDTLLQFAAVELEGTVQKHYY